MSPDSSGESLDEVHEGVQELYDTFWNHSWTELPSEQEQEIERAFEIVRRVHDQQEGRR